LDWISYIKKEEDKALKEIYKTCREDVLRWLVRDFSCDNEEALDIFQTSLIVLYDNVMTGKLKELSTHVNGYIKAVAKNKVMELIREKNRDLKKGEAYVLIKIVQQEQISQDQFSQENEFLIDILSKALHNLGDPCKKILTLYYYHNRNMEEITSEMGYKNPDTTKNQKYKCLKRLQILYFEHIDKKTRSEKQ
jgi:RNA polymerase sigma factor (sigma-70 family)